MIASRKSPTHGNWLCVHREETNQFCPAIAVCAVYGAVRVARSMWLVRGDEVSRLLSYSTCMYDSRFLDDTQAWVVAKLRGREPVPHFTLVSPFEATCTFLP